MAEEEDQFFLINENHSCNDDTIKNDDKKHFENKHLREHCEETPENLKRWSLTDNATTTSMGTDEEIFMALKNTRPIWNNWQIGFGLHCGN